MTLDGPALQEKFAGRCIGRKIITKEETGSTNQDVLALARGGEEEGVVLFADHQSSGRGRLNRVWESPPGTGLYFSVLIKPEIPPDSISLLPIIAGLAVCETLRDQADLFTVLKWPNDVIIKDRKIAGILSEALAMDDGSLAVALGIGINVNTRASEFSQEISSFATSIKIATGQTFDRGRIARATLRRLDDWYFQLIHEGYEPIVRRWSELSGTLGHKVVVDTGCEKIRGKALRLGREGALVLRLPDGEEKRITIGDVKHVSRSA